MGPLWSWVILWLISAYGLAFMLRRGMAQVAVEVVPVLVATPTPSEPAESSEEPAEETPELDSQPSEDSLEAEVPDSEPLDPTPPQEEPAEPAASASIPEPEVPLDEAPLDEAPLGEEPEVAIASEPGVKEKEVLEADAPWIQEKEVHEADAPWIKEKEDPEADSFGVQEKEAHDADAPWIMEKEIRESDAPEGQVMNGGEDDALLTGAEDLEPSVDEEPVYRSISLENLTLGVEASEIQERYGSPGHMSKVGEDGEQWRYPLNASDDRGDQVEGVLVLEFQRGRLVSKALEETETSPQGA